jgi:ectoine hydroxylase
MLERVACARFDATERAQLARDGYVVRQGAFDAGEVAAIARDCEDLLIQLASAKRREKRAAGSYMFELQRSVGVIVKWEPGAPDVVQGIEPFAHISPPLHAWATDPRLIEPCKDVVGENEIILFTEKLNVKRASRGGAIVLHQDYPYWENMTPVAHRIATAMVFLDDTTIENGCLEVAPGTHAVGKWPQRTDTDGFGSLEMDRAAFDESRLIPLEVPAGTVAFFGAFLVHRSLPNRSARDRRALLFSYQPYGHRHSREIMNLVPA